MGDSGWIGAQIKFGPLCTSCNPRTSLLESEANWEVKECLMRRWKDCLGRLSLSCHRFLGLFEVMTRDVNQ